jgi:hypothetical protein
MATNVNGTSFCGLTTAACTNVKCLYYEIMAPKIFIFGVKGGLVIVQEGRQDSLGKGLLSQKKVW